MPFPYSKNLIFSAKERKEKCGFVYINLYVPWKVTTVCESKLTLKFSYVLKKSENQLQTETHTSPFSLSEIGIYII